MIAVNAPHDDFHDDGSSDSEAIEAIKHNICVELYTHLRISQSDFPVKRFVQHKSTETKMTNKFLSTWGQADRLTTRQGTREEKKRMERAKKKKDVGSSSL